MIFLLMSGCAMAVLLVTRQRCPALRIPLALVAVVLAGVALLRILFPAEKPVVRFYRSIDGAVGQVLAEKVRGDQPGAKGTVLLLQFVNAGAPVDRLVREQRRGVEAALAGSGLSIRAAGPEARPVDPGADDSLWGERELRAWLEPVTDPVAVISFIGLPEQLNGPASWPPMYVLQLDPALSLRRLVERGIVKAVARSHGGMSPLEPPEGELAPLDLFGVRYELVADPKKL
jgi:hypothetical protein